MKLAVALTLVTALVAAASAAADTQSEWDASVAAMQSVDPTIAVPPYNPAHVLAVGGGTFAGSSILGLGAPNFGFGATVAPAGPSGAMTVVGSVPGVTLHAQVTCVVAAALPGGGGIATIIGHLTQPDLGPDAQLIFNVTDSGDPAGTGDLWSGTQTSGAPCVLFPPGGIPIVGNITIHVP